ncbi:MAG: hypothetical protein V9G20_20300 [Candidatus Promineifilaceae bacterium]
MLKPLRDHPAYQTGHNDQGNVGGNSHRCHLPQKCRAIWQIARTIYQIVLQIFICHKEVYNQKWEMGQRGRNFKTEGRGGATGGTVCRTGNAVSRLPHPGCPVDAWPAPGRGKWEVTPTV